MELTPSREQSLVCALVGIVLSLRGLARRLRRPGRDLPDQGVQLPHPFLDAIAHARTIVAAYDIADRRRARWSARRGACAGIVESHDGIVVPGAR